MGGSGNLRQKDSARKEWLALQPDTRLSPEQQRKIAKEIANQRLSVKK